MLAHQATALRDLLQRAPGLRATLTEEALVRRLHDLPWSVVNAGAARDVAVLYCFTPFLDTSGLVAAQRLRVRGEVTDVVAQDLTGLRREDPTSSLLADPVTARRVSLPGPARFNGWDPVRRFVDGSVAQVERWIEEQGPYRSIYSRALKLPSHFAAALLKHRHPEMRWIAEFSDPLLVNPLGDVRVSPLEDDWIVRELRGAIAERGFPVPEGLGIYDWGEQIAYALADELWFTNAHQVEVMLDSCPNPVLAGRARELAQVHAHPTLPPAFYNAVDVRLEVDPDVVNLGYFGNFYRTRGLHELLDVLPRLDVLERSRLHLHVFTSQVGQLAREVEARDLHDVVTVRQLRPFLEFLALTQHFDVLIANDGVSAANHRLNPYLPSKVSDYLGSGRPMWAIRETGSVLSGIPTAYATEIGDHDGALRALREMLAAQTVERSRPSQ